MEGLYIHIPFCRQRCSYCAFYSSTLYNIQQKYVDALCKEIALRKIHGATLRDILGIFVKEYGLIVIAASAVAFPIGYMIMKEWVAQYVKQAPIAWWIYVSIFLAIVLLIALSVGSRVWRTVRENPAEVVKSGN